ncbi:hypothetical protein AWL63_19810 [Sphingomonas panacis]|uniref:Major facilitator superfamily (MFS) profile domain-containing protein n=1 Tax=Sphingomonas panacis TaxID=1560345 RepID=A0A1B3ZEJ7_9SPHN|nr:MFS transporter [Sphingomonas panacis]AOH85866.1 hypothetical protein AWL63_19810 [Sphingomonas panacis]
MSHIDLDRPAADAPKSVSWPSRRRAWYTVTLLGLLYIISWIDRNILALLAQPVSQALGLDDRRMALLLGLGFALLYAVGGLLLGHFVDTRSRRVVVTVGIVTWSVATILSAFAASFGVMLVLRCGVAIGEAVLMPAAISLIGDLFPQERRGLPVAVIASIGGVMTIGSYAAGAVAIGVAGAISPGTGLAAWQTSLILVGVPGLAFALIFALTATVPARGGAAENTVPDVSMRALIEHFQQRFAFLGPLLSLTGLNALFSLSTVIWLPTVLIREHSMTASRAGYLISMVGVPAGLLGNFFWQWCGTRLQRRDARRGVLRSFVPAAGIAGPCFVVGAISNSPTLQLAGFAGGMFAGTAFAVLTPIAIQLYTPAQMRARMVSMNFLIISVLGYGVGPLAASELGKILTTGTGELRVGLLAITIATWPLLLAATLLTNRNADGPGQH